MSAVNYILEPSQLPVAQLESLRSKINQMIESIQLLQRTIEVGGQNAMPAWPDILSKYTILLSQSHNLSMSLVGTFANSAVAARSNGTGAGQAPPSNPYEKLALHPIMPMSDALLDSEIIPLLRNQQTTEVLRAENETVRHLAEHMRTRGSLGVLAPVPTAPGPGRRGMGGDAGKKTEYEDVLRECEQIKLEHDERVDRAVRAVTLLREKYDWKARVEVDQEEPEELEWDPRLQASGEETMNGNGDVEAESEPTPDEQSNDSEEEEELEEVLGNGSDHSQEGTPQPGTTSSPMVEG